MSGPIEGFFRELGKRGHVSLLEKASGTLLVELKDGDRTSRWYVAIKRGDVAVSRRGSAADCVVRTEASTFETILAGQLNAAAAVLRGLLEVEGKVNLLVALQALFKPSAGAADQPTAGYARRPR